MHRLLVFDLDGTLANVGKSMVNADVEKLIELEKAGYMIAICSGKPSYYLCGFARQLGLKGPILIGENGATFQFGIELPPRRYEVYPYSESAREQLDMMRTLIDRECGDKVWYQPNEVELTPFPKDAEAFELIQKLIDGRTVMLDELLVYRHIDSFDLTPKNINKFNGLAYLIELLGLEAKDVIAVGDGVNDIPMFEFADLAIGIAVTGGNETRTAQESTGTGQGKEKSTVAGHVEYVFSRIGEALDFISENEL